ncbi:saccharopine dehydrogenase, partial [Escherichia coli]|uniref:saccharopine dehydrogenase NADP-binding domain-containing protein n=5 Tax=Pseudomonadota TaxID=1224 RepID=UPI0015C47E46|nr:saccharopine dehydrogenase [Escherichia coli]
FNGFSAVTIADLSQDAAARAACLCGGRAVKIDIEDAAVLGGILRQHDIVVSTVGPASRFAVPLLRQVVAAGCHFVDVTDDP